MTQTLHIQLLGQFSLEAAGRPAHSLASPRLQALLAYLLLHRHAPVARAALAFLFWPDTSESQARTNLRNLLHRLRRALPEGDRFLHVDAQNVQWRADAPFTLDVAEFEAALVAARQAVGAGDRPAWHAALKRALEAYRGELLPGCYDEWLLAERERLHQQFLAALARLVDLAEEAGDYTAAIQAAQRLLRHDPVQEAPYQRLMQLYSRTGDRASALRVYQTCATVLERELGVAPSPATRAAYEALLQAEAQPTGATAGGPAAPAGHNLPYPLTSFIGRAQAIAEVQRLLAATRLLTLSGPGGCGKSRLALETAHRTRARYPGGAWLVELAAVSDPAAVPEVVAAALGVPEQRRRSPAETLVDALQPRHALLILDNCEHLVEACAALAQRLLRACPRLQIVATSREALGAEGETVWVVPSLTLPEPRRAVQAEHLRRSEAAQLFIERAVSALPTFSVTPTNAQAIAEVCRRLDGLPLAIELAAVQVKVLAVEQIAERLDDSLRLLRRSPRAALPRHQTLRATLDWSHNLLSEPERVLFRRLAAFAGSWSLAAAEDVVTDPGPEAAALPREQVLSLLAQLVDKSLVVVEGHAGGRARYALLEVVRQYAREQLEAAGEAPAVRRRQRDWCLRLAASAEPELRGPEQVAWLHRLEAEHDNLNAALRWSLDQGEHAAAADLAGALWWFWWVRGHWSEGRAWLERVVAEGSRVAPAARAKVLHGTGWIARDQGHSARAAEALQASLALYRDLGDRLGTARVLRSLGWQVREQGNYEQAAVWLEESLALFRALGDQRGIADALHGLGYVADHDGDYQRLVALNTESRQLYEAVGDQRGIASVLHGLGWAAYAQGDYARAREHYEGCLARLRTLGSKRDLAAIMRDLGNTATAQGDYARAAAHYEEGLALCHECGNKRGMAAMLNGLGELARVQGDYAQATARYEAELALCREMDLKPAMAHAFHNLGHVAHNQGHLPQAAAYFRDSLALFQAAGNRPGMAYCVAGLAGLAATAGPPAQAARLLGAATALFERMGLKPSGADALDHERSVAAARASLPPEALAAAWAEGEALSLEDAAAEAMVLAGDFIARDPAA